MPKDPPSANWPAVRRKFIEAGGSTTQSFGLGRILGQIYALLYLSPTPLCLDDIVRELSVSKASVSTTVRQLERWSAVKRVWVQGDRKDYYEAETDFHAVLRHGLLATVRKKLDTAGSQINHAESSLRETRARGNGKSHDDLAVVMQRLDHPNVTLEDVQRDQLNLGGDRHAIVVDPSNRMLYEFAGMRRTSSGWQAAQASIFDLKTNKLRHTGWTSADAAGLPIFPAVVRYDELKRGQIDHALRVTVRKTRQDFVAPATHYASRLTDENLPRMGERLRLRQDFDVSGFSPEVRTILVALKRYGMFVADNGIEWAISVAPDERIPVLHEEMRRVKGSDFEVVVAP